MPRDLIQWTGPKSRCECGHLGDGPNGQHMNSLESGAPGHGPCVVEECECMKFTWADFLPSYRRYMKAYRKAAAQ